MDVRDQIALGAILVALVTSISTALFAWLNYKREKLNQKIQYANLKQQYFNALRTWADNLSDLLSEAIHFSELEPARCINEPFFERRNRIRIALSSMIDRGRWFFPNLTTEEIGQTKEKAFRGYRQNVLNSLVEAYDIVIALDYKDRIKNKPLRSQIVEMKRVFVSEIQEILDPAERDEEFEVITSSVAVIKRTAQPNRGMQRTRN